ncbi:MAG: hypothetical protein HYR96_08440 [Deltaproteobacteria bacterium]|nr:hypothetical protein [Deltaproteobacteria bacterium]MBI3295690.1 hypothetical protein [Deltaproteobacteria bacterium]
MTTSDVSAATTVYFTPLGGNKIALYSNSLWQQIFFSETSVAVPSTTTTPFDIFAYNNSGTLALEALSWSSDTARATALTTLNGIDVKSGDSSRRYLGTGRTTGSSGQTEDSTSKRFLWNRCNRLPRKLRALSTSDTWDYTTATWRAANNDTTTGVTRVEFVVGMQIEPLDLDGFVPGNHGSTDTAVTIGIGINSTSANTSDVYGAQSTLGAYMGVLAHYNGYPGLGYSYAQWLEIALALGTVSWYTSSQSGGVQRQGGLTGEIWS